MYKKIIWICVALLPFTSSAQSGGSKNKTKVAHRSQRNGNKKIDRTLDLLESKQPGLPPATSSSSLAITKEEITIVAKKGKAQNHR